jgi:hypothetical protein
LTNTNADGSINIAGAPASVELTGGDTGSGVAGESDYTIEISGGGQSQITFDWGYNSVDDPGFDAGGYEVNGTLTILAFGSGANGSETMIVNAGDLFGFTVETTDNMFGAGALTIYNFSVILISSCIGPVGLNTSNITSTSADVIWNGQEPGSTYELEWGFGGFIPGSGAELGSSSGTTLVSNNTYSIGGLIENTVYDWYVREICIAGDTSIYSGATFTTISTTCPQPQGVVVLPEAMAVTVNWSMEPLVSQGTQIQYKIPTNQGGGPGMTVIGTPGTTSKMISDL